MSDDEHQVYEYYTIHIFGFHRQFVNQKSFNSINVDMWVIEFESIQTLTEKLFPLVQPFIKRMVEFDNDVPRWAIHEEVTVEELPMFLTLWDDKARATYQYARLTDEIIGYCDDGRSYNLFVHIYSNNVVTRSQFITVEKSLLRPEKRDRAGAVKESAIQSLMKELLEIHGSEIRGANISYHRWASYLYDLDPLDRAKQLKESPPGHLSHLFARVQSDAEAMIQDLRDNLSIGQGVNQASLEELQGMRTTLERIKKLGQQLMEEVNELDKRLTSAESRSKGHNDTLRLINESLPPEETGFGVALYDQIGQQDDIDHV